MTVQSCTGVVLVVGLAALAVGLVACVVESYNVVAPVVVVAAAAVVAFAVVAAVAVVVIVVVAAVVAVVHPAEEQ